MGFCCIASTFYNKPQLDLIRKAVKSRCIASSFYIKPQQSSRLPVPCRVVLHPLSTSNHNWFFFVFFIAFVVLHPLSTSNHNCLRYNIQCVWLYCILFLHQTTTFTSEDCLSQGCIASSFYIKPQHISRRGPHGVGCIASSFYIKPQQRSYIQWVGACCIASSFYIKPQLSATADSMRPSCIASSFYIKPQLKLDNIFKSMVVLHPLSTSNHNWIFV